MARFEQAGLRPRAAIDAHPPGSRQLSQYPPARLRARAADRSLQTCGSMCRRSCAELLHADEVDLGLIPSIEYPGHDYRIVPGVSIASDGPVASVAIFSKVPTDGIRSIALDTSSRTSHALLRVLCARWFEIDPGLVSMPPDLAQMLERVRRGARDRGQRAVHRPRGPGT